MRTLEFMLNIRLRKCGISLFAIGKQITTGISRPAFPPMSGGSFALFALIGSMPKRSRLLSIPGGAMQITDAMLEAGIRKATEAGLFPRHTSNTDRVLQRNIMRAVIEAALQESDGRLFNSAIAPLRPKDRWSFFSSK